jgi:hypothetical protein
MGAGIQPGRAPGKQFHGQLTPGQIERVHIRDLKFSAGRRFDLFCNLDHVIVIKIQARDRIVGFGVCRVGADKCLGQAVRRRLHRIFQANPPSGPVSQQIFETLLILGGGDDQDMGNTRQHQSGQGIVDHGLVIHRHELFADRIGQRIQTGAGTAGQYDSFNITALSEIF